MSITPRLPSTSMMTGMDQSFDFYSRSSRRRRPRIQKSLVSKSVSTPLKNPILVNTPGKNVSSVREYQTVLTSPFKNSAIISTTPLLSKDVARHQLFDQDAAPIPSSPLNSSTILSTPLKNTKQNTLLSTDIEPEQTIHIELLNILQQQLDSLSIPPKHNTIVGDLSQQFINRHATQTRSQLDRKYAQILNKTTQDLKSKLEKKASKLKMTYPQFCERLKNEHPHRFKRFNSIHTAPVEENFISLLKLLCRFIKQHLQTFDQPSHTPPLSLSSSPESPKSLKNLVLDEHKQIIAEIEQEYEISSSSKIWDSQAWNDVHNAFEIFLDHVQPLLENLETIVTENEQMLGSYIQIIQKLDRENYMDLFPNPNIK